MWLEKNIRHWCGLFVFVNHSRIYLIHQTAKEFLTCDSGSTAPLSGWKHCLNPQEIENDMTRICVDFLCFEGSGPKAQYLVRKFNEYRIRSIDNILDKDTASIFRLYDIDSDLYDLWFTIFWKAARCYESRPRINSIRLAALLGHDKVLELMLQSNKYCDINESDDNGGTALMWASEFGHEKVVHVLLDRGADVNVQGGQYANALQAASVGGHEKVVQMLLNRGADVDTQVGFYTAPR
jgi:ankyrin repeat protein